MSFETDLQARLSEDTAVVSLINQRIYPVFAPAEATKPYSVYLLKDKLPIYSHSGCSRLSQFTIQISCYADNYDETKQLAGAIGQALDSWIESEKIQSALQIKEEYNYEVENPIYQTQITFSIIYNEI